MVNEKFEFTQKMFYAARLFLASKLPDCTLTQNDMAKKVLHVAPNLYSKWERGDNTVPAVAMTAMNIVIKAACRGLNLDNMPLTEFYKFCQDRGVTVDDETFGQDHFAIARSFLCWISPEAKANQEDVAKMLGVMTNLYSKWERGGGTGNRAPAIAITAMRLILKLSIAGFEHREMDMKDFIEFVSRITDDKVKMT